MNVPIKEFNDAQSITADECLNSIIHGDCLTVMRKMPAKSVDVVITSPPYNLLNSTGNGLKKNTNCGKWKNAAIKNGYGDYDDNMPYPEYISWQQECVAEMYRLIKDDGVIFYNNKNRVQGGLLQDRREIVKDLPVRQIITWKRSGAINFNPGYFLPTTEQIYMICNKPFKLVKGANKWTDVWEIKQEMHNPHPAPFPEALIDRIVSSTTGQIILDPFAGSSTTAVSSMRYGRDFIMIEKSASYCQMSKMRIDGEEDWACYGNPEYEDTEVSV
ncbi:MAG: site-specific DNA-methyltransferase [Oscillospiraceae bacterium]|nr:site-specific DNA-methyltransferase [Oscillospiraceae bacterium]